MTNAPGISVQNVSKKFSRELKRALHYGAADVWNELLWWRGAHSNVLRRGEFWAVQNVSFSVEPGQSLGIIGENGAGKSTLLKMLQGLLKPDTGRIEVRGKMCALDLGSGMIPWLSGLENIEAQAALLGVEPRRIQARTDAILEFADLGEFINTPVSFYSTGMRARLGFAIATQLEPDILLVDEALAVGDFAFQRKCRTYIQNFLNNGGILVFVGHAIEQVQMTCQLGVVLEHGQTLYQGSAVDAIDFYIKRKSENDSTPLRDSSAALHTPVPTEQEPVRITQVEMLPTETETLQTDKPAEILVHYNSLRCFERVSWSVTLFKVEIGMHVAGAISPPQTLVPGSGTLRCRLAHLPLLDGTYALKISIGDANTTIPLARSGWQDPAYAVSIINPPSLAGNLGALVNVLVQLQVEWEESSLQHAASSSGNGALAGH